MAPIYPKVSCVFNLLKIITWHLVVSINGDLSHAPNEASLTINTTSNHVVWTSGDVQEASKQNSPNQMLIFH